MGNRRKTAVAIFAVECEILGIVRTEPSKYRTRPSQHSRRITIQTVGDYRVRVPRAAGQLSAGPATAPPLLKLVPSEVPPNRPPVLVRGEIRAPYERKGCKVLTRMLQKCRVIFSSNIRR